MAHGDIGIIACRSGLPFAEAIIAGLEHQYQKTCPKGTWLQSDLMRRGLDSLEVRLSNSRSLTGGMNLRRRLITGLKGELFPPRHFRLINYEEIHFPNGEIRAEILESIRGADIYVIQDCENKVDKFAIDKNFVAGRHALDAAKKAGAGRLSAVLPYLPYSRQDVPRGRQNVSAARVIRDLESDGVDQILTLDVHNPAIAGICEKALFEDLHASKNHLDYIIEHVPLENLVVCSPDTGAVNRNRYFANVLKTELAMIWKRRDYSGDNEVDEMQLLGDVRGKDVLLVDDMIATAGTLIKACELLKEQGARDIYFATSLPLLTHPAIDRIDDAYERGIIKQIIGTDAVYHGGKEFSDKHPWYVEVSVADYFAKVIWNLNHDMSISELLRYKPAA
ncbi:hypothetical protein CL619_01000 [archaeon]|nr:hypothetical protein [archaeon]|tara:strand:+ start:2988 stop:4163 length:1176 start_codon:yes stop_codon:yes gene_type:complete